MCDCKTWPLGWPLAFLFRKTYSLTEFEKERAARTITDRVKAQAGTDGEPPEIKDPLQFREAIDDMLKTPRTYDDELFRDMGVEVIWYDSHDDVPALLYQIAPPRNSRGRSRVHQS